MPSTTDTVTTTETDTAITVDMRHLLAAATIANHANTKNRPMLRSIFVGAGVLVATDSYRLVVVGDADQTAEELALAAKSASGHGFCIPGDVVATASKLAKKGPASITTDGVTVTLSIAGQTFTADRPDVTTGDYPNFGTLIPSLDHGCDASPRWDAEYLADMAKVGKLLKGSSGGRSYVDLVVSDAMKPTLWRISADGEGSALYLLMPVRHI